MLSGRRGQESFTTLLLHMIQTYRESISSPSITVCLKSILLYLVKGRRRRRRRIWIVFYYFVSATKQSAFASRLVYHRLLGPFVQESRKMKKRNANGMDQEIETRCVLNLCSILSRAEFMKFNSRKDRQRRRNYILVMSGKGHRPPGVDVFGGGSCCIPRIIIITIIISRKVVFHRRIYIQTYTVQNMTESERKESKGS